MFTIAGMGSEYITVGDGWVEKVRGNQSVMKAPLSRFKDVGVEEVTRKTKLFGGVKEQRLEVVINVGTFMTLTVPVDRRAEVEQLRALLAAG